jgi:hypothetical protein
MMNCDSKTSCPVLQGWDNFRQEWKQLRRSFRYDEYKRISALNPPQTPLGQVGDYGALVAGAGGVGFAPGSTQEIHGFCTASVSRV